jgi:SWI/SNF-related matrix-associated actin-dependent regulator of chromatin subfamily A3
MLRRSKNAIILPRRKDHRRFLRLSAQEQQVYNIAKQKAIKYLEDDLASCKSQESYSNALQKINALRVICELGCSPPPGLHITLPNSVAYGSLLAPRTMDESSMPIMMMDDTEDDDCRLETDKRPCGDISSRLQECFPPYTTSGIDVSLCLEDPTTESPVASGQWPTKIQALIEDLQTCAVGTKTYLFPQQVLELLQIT